MHLENEPALDQSALAKKIFSHYAKLKFEPGEKAVYTNVGYMMLGAIIEAVSKQTYEDYVVTHILKPIGMNLTDFMYHSNMLPDAAVGSHPLISLESLAVPFLYDTTAFVRDSLKGRVWFNRFLADSNPPTGLIGPSTDLARFMMAFLNRGELDGARILSAESVERMIYEGHVKSGKSFQVAAPFRGLGWAVFKGEDKPFHITHGGGGPGFGSAMRLYPEQSLGILVIANDTTYDREVILDLVASLFLEKLESE